MNQQRRPVFQVQALILSFLTGLLTVSATTGAAQASGTEKFYENASGTPILPVIKSAKRTLDIEIYTMNDPLVIQALKDAQARGVKVRIVQDGSPSAAGCHIFQTKSSSDSKTCTTEKELVSYIRSHGGEYVEFNKAELCALPGGHCFQHGKMLVIDQRRSLMSTGNFDTTNLCNKKEHPNNCNRDYTILSDDPKVVNTLESVFEHDLKGRKYDVASVVAAGGASDKMTVSPLAKQDMINFIKSAKKTVQIQTQYIKDPDLVAALVETARRGVDVFVNTASFCSFGTPKQSEVAKAQQIYDQFDQAGIHSKLFTRYVLVNNVQGYLHAKAILIDSTNAWVGSINGSTTSLENNREFGIYMNDSENVNALAGYLYSDYANPNAESWQDSLTCAHDPHPTPQVDEPDGQQYLFGLAQESVF